METCEKCGGYGQYRVLDQHAMTITGKLCECLQSCDCDEGVVYRWRDGYEWAVDCCRCAQARTAVRLTTLAGIPGRYVDSTLRLKNTTSSVFDAAVSLARWLKESTPALTAGGKAPAGWTLRGPCGTGKTHMLCAVSWMLIDCGVRVQFADLAEYLRGLRRSMEDNTASHMRHLASRVPVLALDEIGGVRTDWERQETADLISSRYARGATTICTTNLTGPQIAEMAGQRVASRLSEMAPEIVVDGPDHRVGR